MPVLQSDCLKVWWVTCPDEVLFQGISHLQVHAGFKSLQNGW